ncbi:cache domain-containing protein [Thiomicrorhabdus aquaedulcis]|uniref:cache domain-containing protein n=1 Tax=Thiomicrorhabdus aquaedulcis TaxID=2211106 RepID=UPI000FD6C3D6|nr:cache domain-containing protein [Thiomicrorhabdus aquaedulcis]
MSHIQQDTVQRFKQYAQALPQVKRYLAQLEQQDLWWTTVAMVGKINNDNIDPQLLVSVVDTQKAFQALRDQMMEALINRYLNQAHSEIKLKAQASIDILNRNLFERTADVGFLAADEDLVQFMAQQPAADEPQRASALRHIEARLEEYVAKYSVYDDIALLSPNGEVLAQLSRAGQQTLNHHNQAKTCHEPWVTHALQGHTSYTEVYAQSSLFGSQPSLFYAKLVQRRVGEQWQTVGVLCLRFKFEQEVNTIFNTLNRAGHENDAQDSVAQAREIGHTAFEFALLGAQGEVLAGKPLAANVLIKPSVTHEVELNAQGALEYVARAAGYEGFMGLEWFSRVSINQSAAFVQGTALESLDGCIEPASMLYLRDLEETNQHVSVLLLIVILNGKMTSLKKDAKAFLPVLDSFQDISRAIELIFNDFIGHIHQVMLKTIHDKVRFSASLAAELMDRNLYERANDCRWWALNNRFRTVLTQHDLSTYQSQGQPLSRAQTQD